MVNKNLLTYRQHAMQLSGNINENWTKEQKQELEFYILATESEEKTGAS